LEPWKFKVAYDKLVFACGAEASTFGIHGVTDHAIFLREVHHAQEIRRRLLLNLMLSDVPGMLALALLFRHTTCANHLSLEQNFYEYTLFLVLTFLLVMFYFIIA